MQNVEGQILGYETSDNRRVRYDRANSIIVIAFVNSKGILVINTMLKPKDKEEYYNENYSRDYSN